jgi:hypothetical protein
VKENNRGMYGGDMLELFESNGCERAKHGTFCTWVH